MKAYPCRLAYALALALGVLHFFNAEAALVGHFRFEEGATDPATNIVYCSASTNTAMVDPASGSLLWVTTGLGQVPSPGTTAALEFTAVSPNGSFGNPNVMTTIMTQDATGNNLAGRTAKTFAAWIKPALVQNDANPTIVHMGNGPTASARCTFKMVAGSGGFVLRFEIQGGGFNGTKNLLDGKWHHVAVVIPTNATLANCKLYVDGVVDVNGSGTAAINTHTNYPVVIGAMTGSGIGGGDRGFTGLIDDVRIYNEPLSASDIISLYLGSGIAPTVTKMSDIALVLGSTNSTVVFEAGALGTPPLTYTWRKDGVVLTGQTSDSLSISPATLSDVGTYSVAVTNAFGGAAKSALLALNTAPIDPPRQAVLLGHLAIFEVSMPADSAGYAYQWKKDGVDIPGATASALTIHGVATTDASTNYQVVVTLGSQSATSTPAAKLSVLPVPSSAYSQFVLADVPAGYWRLGEANGATVAIDQTGFYPGTYVGYSGFELGYQGALLNDSDKASHFTGANYVQVPYDPELVRADGLTLETWVKPTAFGAKQTLINCEGNLPVYGFELFISDTGAPVFRTYRSTVPSAATPDQLTSSILIPAGSWSHVVATYDGSTKRLYVNGALAGTQSVLYFPVKDVNLRFGAGIGGLGAIANPFSGELDDIAIYSKALNVDQIQDHYAVATTPPGTTPMITGQPQNVSVVLGDTNATVTFSVTAAGSPRLAYQWLRDSVNIPGATNRTLVIPSAGTSGVASYAVMVTNAAGSAKSSGASLSYIAGQVTPTTLTSIAGGSAAFTVQMPAYQPYTYQWKRDSVNLSAATQPTLELGNVSVADSANYSVVVSLGQQSVESSPATLTVLPMPTFKYTNIVMNGATPPVAYWRLAEVSAIEFAVDLMGGRNAMYSAGALPGAEGVVLGDSNTALECTGAADSCAEVFYDPALNPSVFTIECWALPRGGRGTFRSPLNSREWTTGTYNGYTFYAAQNNRWELWLGQGATPLIITGPEVQDNVWTHLAATYDGANAAFYVNGSLVTNVATAYVPNPFNPTRIGAGGAATANYGFRGLVDEVVIYDSALPAATIASHYAGVFQPLSQPRITKHPRGGNILAGETYTASVGIHSAPPSGLIWQRNGTTIPGASGTKLAVPNIAVDGNYTALVTNATGQALSRTAAVKVLSGQATSIRFRAGSTNTIAANGGYAGFVSADNWNEIAANSSSGTVASLVDASGVTLPMSVTWSAAAGGGSTGVGPSEPYGDFVLLDGRLEGNSTQPISITLSGIPASYQSGGYTAYVYLGTEGVTDTTQFGFVAAGGVTNYYHGTNLSRWNGEYIVATSRDEASLPPANYAVFTNLSSPTLTITAGKPATVSGPARVTGIQLVANASPAVSLGISMVNGAPVLTWPGNWILQRKDSLQSGPDWIDVEEAMSPYNVPPSATLQQFYRLRSP